jgi:hypothetical protein
MEDVVFKMTKMSENNISLILIMLNYCDKIFGLIYLDIIFGGKTNGIFRNDSFPLS